MSSPKEADHNLMVLYLENTFISTKRSEITDFELLEIKYN